MPKVPSNTTGTAIVGIRVARKFCKKRYITANTKIMASINVLITLLIETFTNGVVSKGTTTFRPRGKKGSNSATAASKAAAVSSALAPVRWEEHSLNSSHVATSYAGFCLKQIHAQV